MASQGPLYAGTASGVDWSLLSNLGADDNSYALALIGEGSEAPLTLTNFGFSIPSGATIDGVAVQIGRKAGSQFGVNSSATLVKGGSATGSPEYDTDWTLSETSYTFGGASSLFSATLSAADVNALNFGVIISPVDLTLEGVTASLDYVRMTVYYTESIGPAPEDAVAMFFMF